MATKTTAPDEGKAISDIGKVLSPFEPDAQGRILQWAFDAFKVKPKDPEGNRGNRKLPIPPSHDGRTPDLEDIGALFEAANPTTTVNRVLVATYWYQTYEEQKTVKGQTVNDALKNLGHAVRNITNQYTALMNRKPQLVRQAAKHGKAQQARKEYKLTKAGQDYVTEMIAAGGDAAQDEE